MEKMETVSTKLAILAESPQMKKVVDASNTFRGCVFRDCPDLYAFALAIAYIILKISA